jgi:ribonuclease HII
VRAAPRLVAGLDEAGRGPVLGPLVVACAITDDPAGLAALGVRDSKALTPAARGRLEPLIKARLKGFALVVLEPGEIDASRKRMSLNAIEGEAFARAAVEALYAAGATSLASLQADAADAKASNFRAMIVRGLAERAPHIRVSKYEVEHKADTRLPAVSAASILAKTERDRRVLAIAASIGKDVGSGYPSDPTTVGFLRDYIRANKDLPAFARRSWKPAQALLREAGANHRALESFGSGGRPP